MIELLSALFPGEFLVYAALIASALFVLAGIIAMFARDINK